jgi:hypothetical protein
MNTCQKFFQKEYSTYTAPCKMCDCNCALNSCFFQHDGNFVLYRNFDNHPLWASGTHGSGAIKAVMQTDGNLGVLFHFNIVIIIIVIINYVYNVQSFSVICSSSGHAFFVPYNRVGYLYCTKI